MSYLTVGDDAPNISLISDSGKTITLSEVIGHPVCLYFYPKDDTSGCTKQALDFSALKDQFYSSNISLYGISPNTKEEHMRFIQKHKLSISLLADPEKISLQAYGVWIQKSMYGRSYMGVERTTYLIDQFGKIAHIWRKVKVPGHAEDVLKLGKSLGDLTLKVSNNS